MWKIIRNIRGGCHLALSEGAMNWTSPTLFVFVLTVCLVLLVGIAFSCSWRVSVALLIFASLVLLLEHHVLRVLVCARLPDSIRLTTT